MGSHVDRHTELLSTWAKLTPNDARLNIHPLICHLIDVATVAEAMWGSVLSTRAKSQIAAGLGMGDSQAAGVWVAFLAGLHDLGKASPGFQLQVRASRQELERRLTHAGLKVPRLNLQRSDVIKHGPITAGALPAILEDVFGVPPTLGSSLSTIVGGHHGTFPRSSELNDAKHLSRPTDSWGRHRRAIVERLATVLKVSRVAVPRSIDTATAMKLAGLVSVADWIGSNTDFFKYMVPADLEDYKRHAVEQATKALDWLRWTGSSPFGGRKSFFELFRFSPNPLQETTVELAGRLQEPGLVIIEAPMGEGKTEAAMYLADNWNAALNQHGYYFALPTQATSNQMFSRVADFLKGRFPGETVQVQLLHGHASLSAEFDVLKNNHNRAFSPRYDGVEDGMQANLVAGQWFTYRKRGLLTPFGVGTIDQALMAVLQTKHFFVRLFGLSHKTLIVDEVHAYDTYMTSLLERLLEWLAALGSPVVMLSATLPKQRRERLLRAYAAGLGDTEPKTSNSAEYPRVSWYVDGQVHSRTVGTSPISRKRVYLEWIDGSVSDAEHEPFVLGQRLKSALEHGGCAAVICNTVRRAQDVYRALKPYFTHTAHDGTSELDLLHSQYLYGERQARERRTLSRFGKPGGEKVQRPHRAVLVATQVIEQSLDLDFDLMITDMAPVDLVLQRVGRLHRHDRSGHRPKGLADPRLLIVAPQMEAEVPAFDPGTKAVYDHHVLLRSWLALRYRDTVAIPDDVEDLIEKVYDDDRGPEQLPDALRRAWEETKLRLEQTRGQLRSKAMELAIQPPSNSAEEMFEAFNRDLEEDSPDVHASLQALTRLSGPTVPVVVLSPDEQNTYIPDNGAGTATAQELLRRSLTISHRGVVRQLLDEDVPAKWRSIPLLAHHRLVVLGKAGTRSYGRFKLTVDPELGVVIESIDEGDVNG